MDNKSKQIEDMWKAKQKQSIEKGIQFIHLAEELDKAMRETFSLVESGDVEISQAVRINALNLQTKAMLYIGLQLEKVADRLEGECTQ